MSTITIQAEFAAIVLKVMVKPGAEVAADEEMLILESMKTEIPVTAPAAGRVSSVSVADGDAVDERQPLVVLET